MNRRTIVSADVEHARESGGGTGRTRRAWGPTVRRVARGAVAIGALVAMACGTVETSARPLPSPAWSNDVAAVAEAIVDIALDRAAVRLDQPEAALMALGDEFRATPDLDDTDWLASAAAVLGERKAPPSGIIRVQLTGEPTRLRVMRIEASFVIPRDSRQELAELIRAGFERNGVSTGVNIDGPPEYIGNEVDPASREGRHIIVIMTPTVAVLRVWPTYVR